MSGKDDDDWKKEVQKSTPMTGRSSNTGKFVTPGKTEKGKETGKGDKTGKSGRSTITGKSGTAGKGARVIRSTNGWTIINARGAANGYFRTQKDAIEGARKIIASSGGGELRIYGKNGAIRGTRNITPDERQPPKD
jgi:hypothetical protein